MTQGKAFLLPPAPDKCQICAVKHKPEQPHNHDSIFYQVNFHMKHKRSATWHDAMEHCSPEVKSLWLGELKLKGVKL